MNKDEQIAEQVADEDRENFINDYESAFTPTFAKNKDNQVLKPSKLKTISPQHYTEASFNIEQAMLAVQSNIFFAELPADLASKLKEEPAIKNALAKALWATIAMKHLCRAGTKADNSVDQELGKIENYAHKSRIGKWI